MFVTLDNLKRQRSDVLLKQNESLEIAFNDPYMGTSLSLSLTDLLTNELIETYDTEDCEHEDNEFYYYFKFPVLAVGQVGQYKLRIMSITDNGDNTETIRLIGEVFVSVSE